MAEPTQPSKRTKCCRVCATDDPFDVSAKPYTEDSAAYLRLLSSQEGLVLIDQGGLAPPHLNGAKIPIVYDNCMPYRYSHKDTVINIEPRVRLSRQGVEPFDPPTGVQPVPYLVKDCNTADHQTLFVDIVEYHRDIARVHVN